MKRSFSALVAILFISFAENLRSTRSICEARARTTRLAALLFELRVAFVARLGHAAHRLAVQGIVAGLPGLDELLAAVDQRLRVLGEFLISAPGESLIGDDSSNESQHRSFLHDAVGVLLQSRLAADGRLQDLFRLLETLHQQHHISTDGITEVLAYGTAVLVEPIAQS